MSFRGGEEKYGGAKRGFVRSVWRWRIACGGEGESIVRALVRDSRLGEGGGGRGMKLSGVRGPPMEKEGCRCT